MVLKLVDGKLQFEEQLLSNIQQKNNDVILPILTSEVVCNHASDGTGATLLHFTSEYGNAEVAQHLLDLGLNVNTRDELGQTPLLIAVTRRNGNISIATINVLLNAGANIFEADIHGKYSLQHVVDGWELENTSVIEIIFKSLTKYCQTNNNLMANLLIKAGCQLDRAMYLGNPAVTEIMIQAGCDVHGPGPHPMRGRKALHVAAQLMDDANLKVLLSHGANATARVIDRMLPLSTYLTRANRPPYCRNLEIVKALLSHYFTVTDNEEDTKISLRHLLHWGSEEEIRHMLEYDIDFSTKGSYGSGLLHWLAANSNSNVTNPFEGRFLDVNMRNQRESTPLHYVTVNSDPSTVKFLLSRGADVHAKNCDGYTPLLYFFRGDRLIPSPGEKEILELFLQHGADIQVVIPKGQKTIFDLVIATQKFNLGDLLLANLALGEKLGKPIIDLIRSKINAHREFKMYYNLCKLDLEDMTKVVVYESITVFNLLAQSDKELIKRHAYNDGLLEEFENFGAKYCSNSNYYYDVLQVRIASILSKVKLIQSATEIIFTRIAPQLNNNYLIVRKIIDCLDNEDMKVLNTL